MGDGSSPAEPLPAPGAAPHPRAWFFVRTQLRTEASGARWGGGVSGRGRTQAQARVARAAGRPLPGRSCCTGASQTASSSKSSTQRCVQRCIRSASRPKTPPTALLPPQPAGPRAPTAARPRAGALRPGRGVSVRLWIRLCPLGAAPHARSPRFDGGAARRGGAEERTGARRGGALPG